MSQDVPPTGLAVTVLGSGGPYLQPARASSGYLVWFDGRLRLLVDCGGGTVQRLGRAEVDLLDLEAVLLTHLHIDHSGDLPAVVFAAWMAERDRPLRVVGPAGRDEQPGAQELCDLTLGDRGAWRYMNTFAGFGLQVTDVPSDPEHSDIAELDVGGVRVTSVAVPHGMMPAVAFRVDAGGRSVTFSGDVSRFHPTLVDLASGTDLLVHDMALPERETPHGHLHAKPSDVGRQAAAARVGSLLLSHVMPELEDERGAAEGLVRRAYDGPVRWAADLETLVV